MANNKKYTEPVGFQGYAQDQYVDNRVTRPIGNAIYEQRSPMEIGYDNTIQQQALGDISDLFIPGAPFISKGVRGINAARKAVPKQAGLGLTDDMIKKINNDLAMSRNIDQEIINIPKSVVANNEQRMKSLAKKQDKLEAKVMKKDGRYSEDDYIDDMTYRSEFKKLYPKDSGTYYPYTDKDIQNWWSMKDYSNNSNLQYINNPSVGDGMPTYDKVIRDYYKANPVVP